MTPEELSRWFLENPDDFDVTGVDFSGANRLEEPAGITCLDSTYALEATFSTTATDTLQVAIISSTYLISSRVLLDGIYSSDGTVEQDS